MGVLEENAPQLLCLKHLIDIYNEGFGYNYDSLVAFYIAGSGNPDISSGPKGNWVLNTRIDD